MNWATRCTPTWPGKAQPYVYSEYSIFVAEVASNFHQALVRAHLLGSDRDRVFKINLIEEAMSNFLRYFFIMPLLAKFELETHQRIERGEGLTADVAIGLMADLLEEGFGGEVAFDHDRDGMHWAAYGHLYADYYVYQYATGHFGRPRPGGPDHGRRQPSSRSLPVVLEGGSFSVSYRRSQTGRGGYDPP